MNWSRIVPDTIRSCLRGERPIIRSDGTYRRDYIYVKDVSSAYARLAACCNDARVQGEAVNVSPERAVSGFSPERAVGVLEIVTRIQHAMGCEHLEPEIQNVAQGEIHAQYLDSTKARQLLHWTPRFSRDEGLAETIAWYRNY